MFKRIIAVLLTGIMLAGCGSKKDETVKTPAPEQSVTSNQTQEENVEEIDPNDAPFDFSPYVKIVKSHGAPGNYEFTPDFELLAEKYPTFEDLATKEAIRNADPEDYADIRPFGSVDGEDYYFDFKNLKFQFLTDDPSFENRDDEYNSRVIEFGDLAIGDTLTLMAFYYRGGYEGVEALNNRYGRKFLFYEKFEYTVTSLPELTEEELLETYRDYDDVSIPELPDPVSSE